jgi:hypothetical protein
MQSVTIFAKKYRVFISRWQRLSLSISMGRKQSSVEMNLKLMNSS